MSEIPARLGVVQRVLPEYRIPFFEMLARACTGGFSLFSGQARPAEAIQAAAPPPALNHYPARNRHFFGGRFYLCYQGGLTDWLGKYDPQVLILEANPRYLSSPAAVRWLQWRKRPVIGWGLGAPKSGALMRRAFLRRFDALITYSQTGFEQYRRIGIPAERIFIAPNAAAPKPAQSPAPRAAEYPDGKAVVLFVGRLQARKRVDVLLQACAQLPEPLQPKVWVVGDGPEKSALEALAAGLYPQAQFFGGKFGAELQPFFQQADLFVLPGTGGLAIQQAMSHGLPVLVGEADGTQADLVRPGNGLLLQPVNAGSLAAAMQTLLADVPRLRRMGAESYRIVAEEINLEAMLAAFARAVNFVLER